MIAVDHPARPDDVASVEACRPPVLENLPYKFSEDELGWFFTVLKHNDSEDRFEQALYYVSRDRAQTRARRAAAAIAFAKSVPMPSFPDH